jgi:acetyl esterase/lipase
MTTMTAFFCRSTIVCLFLASLFLVGGKITPAYARSTSSLTTFSYGNASSEQFLNIYYPPSAGPFPFVVFVHGGGWISGSANVGRTIAEGLTPAGFAVVSLEYRKPPAVSPSDTVEDIAEATAYVLNNAARLNLLSNHFAFLAHSAGSQMVALVATDPAYAAKAGLDLSKLAAVGVLDGIFDLTAAIQSDDKAQKRDHQLDLFGNDPNYWRAMSPVNALDQTTIHPIFCIIHEDTVPVFQAQAQRFITALHNHQQVVSEFVMNGEVLNLLEK